MADRFPEVPRAAAHRFNQVAWPAFAVLMVAGAWNIAAVPGQITGSYRTAPIVKLVGVAISGVRAAVHARSRRLVPPAACRRA